MVLKLSTIPVHIQMQIVSQMDFDDYRKFLESSKHGKSTGSLTKPIKDVDSINISQRGSCMENFESRRSLSLANATIYKQCPRFCIRNFGSNEYIPVETCLKLIELGKEGRIMGKCATLSISALYSSPKSGQLRHSMEMDTEVFIQFVEVFNIREFNCSHMDSEFTKHPIMHQMDRIWTNCSFEDDNFLSLTASCINLGLNSLNSSEASSTVNQFLKQWFFNERRIDFSYLSIDIIDEWTPTLIQEVFEGLTYSVLWSPDTHSTSILSHIPLEIVQNTDSQYRPIMYCLLNNGKTNLLIKFYPDNYLHVHGIPENDEGSVMEFVDGLCVRLK